MNNHKYRLIIADDHQILRESLVEYLKNQGHTIVAEAESFDALETLIKASDADLIICDCRMDGCGPVNFLAHLKRFSPEMKIIFLSGMQSELTFHRLLADGANAVISKKNGLGEIVKAIGLLDTHRQYVSPEISELLAKNTELSSMEMRVLEYLVAGLSNTQVAEKMHKSPATINTHRTNIMKKLNVHSIVDLVKYCQRNQLFDS